MKNKRSYLWNIVNDVKSFINKSEVVELSTLLTENASKIATINTKAAQLKIDLDKDKTWVKPLALQKYVDEDMPVVFIVTERGYEKVVSNIHEIRARGGRIIIITTEVNDELKTYSDHIIYVPQVHHCLQSVLTTIPLQLLAYHIAVLKGCDVDMPRNLAKSVTVE